MAQHVKTHRFEADWQALTSDQRKVFVAAFLNFEADLASGRFRDSLGVRQIPGTPGAREMTWAPEGRATFEVDGEPPETRTVVWRRVAVLPDAATPIGDG